MKETTTRILLIEDDHPIRSRVATSLRAEGYQVREAADARQARVALPDGFDLVLLDLGLPDEDGVELCRSIRRGDQIPIIILTAREGTGARVRGLDAGADDYLIKPFDLEELFARIRSVLRRTQSPNNTPAQCGDLWADPETRKAGRDQLEFELKPREFDLLFFLLRHPDRVWTRDQLLDQVWGPGFEGEARTVDLHVRRLRAKVEVDSGDPRYIKTVWGVGYTLSGGS